MGYIRHHAIIVTGWNPEGVKVAREQCHRICAEIAQSVAPPVTPVVESPSNSYASFAVLPDGSQEGWSASDLGDECRAAVLRFLTGCCYSDGSSPLRWVEVQYGDDELSTLVVAGSDAPLRASRAEVRSS